MVYIIFPFCQIENMNLTMIKVLAQEHLHESREWQARSSKTDKNKYILFNHREENVHTETF